MTNVAKVDTCCIDKRDSVKLSEAINSMYSWYQRSARCYVYLSYVVVQSRSIGDSRGSEAPLRQTWKLAFQKSKWFTRGWTLQELLAPSSVDFFTSQGLRLRDRRTLSQEIHEATTIALEVLQKHSLSPSSYSIEGRTSWAAGRETKREEDAAYSLLGLFGVHLPPIYGEGRSNAFDRLHWEVERKSAIAPRTGVLPATRSTEGGVSGTEPLPIAPKFNQSTK
jgi:hypothetical protein